jgi:hypothetical protein
MEIHEIAKKILAGETCNTCGKYYKCRGNSNKTCDLWVYFQDMTQEIYQEVQRCIKELKLAIAQDHPRKKRDGENC